MPVQLGAPPQHGFDQPLGLLSDCHRRIENFLGFLHEIAQTPAESLDPQQRSAVESALTYFRTAAHRHNEDEERSLFPLLRNSSEPTVRAAMDQLDLLEADHAAAAPIHEEIDRLYREWLDAGSISPEKRSSLANLLENLVGMYQQHIDTEDRTIFPLAAAALNHEQLAQIGHEMAQRRGIVKHEKV